MNDVLCLDRLKPTPSGGEGGVIQLLNISPVSSEAPVAVMSPSLGSAEGHGGRGRVMRAERDNVMEREQQSW